MKFLKIFINITMEKNNKKQELYVLIDSSGILFHQYYGMKNVNSQFLNNYKINLSNKEIDLSAIVGYFNFLKKIKNEYDEVPEENFIHILDAEGGSEYRKSIYPEYKANRREKEEDLNQQKKLLGLFLKSLDQKFLQIEGVEADDVIGTMSKKLSNEGHLVLIITYDKDLFQLLNYNISLARSENLKRIDENGEIIKDKIKSFNFYTEDYIYQNYGFPPETIVDYLAFTGDIADNIPGVKGIGDKAAKELLKEYVNIEGVLNNLDKIKPSYKKKIEEQKDNLILSKKLALIQTDLKNVPDVNNIKNDINITLKNNLLKILKELKVVEE